ncbi:hypothetical protein LMG3458_00092 [Achromobacter deleyi]|uniref:Lipoprotein n=1 Tax=Achromobacter deleyi TaxID=1353891 RepID=A0A6S6Z521_9BURK|nr:hypothetical protein [Achromobacter deleyi]CAB3651516.1 hypothetical protein LMG3458_00092 [Achromobacter deleyi]CAB3817316.1 hypothetical protein LMG3481_00069 [Achromobacter deleyi]CAB3824626.1 hypothetical protein LMG3482_00448 [Achromobacter deleyi]
MKVWLSIAMGGVLAGCAWLHPMENTLSALHGKPVSQVAWQLGPPNSKLYLNPLFAGSPDDPDKGATVWSWTSRPYVYNAASQSPGFSTSMAPLVCVIRLTVNGEGIIYASRVQADDRAACEDFRAKLRRVGADA